MGEAYRKAVVEQPTVVALVPLRLQHEDRGLVLRKAEGKPGRHRLRVSLSAPVYTGEGHLSYCNSSVPVYTGEGHLSYCNLGEMSPI